ncbi:MAG TPA: efflux RND transporter periplasmic adaptor subunit [Chlamydiales bacterium]|nr:efflux RND transporter periplasmic adaptor subunit [Chlamydiales bacterium]
MKKTTLLLLAALSAFGCAKKAEQKKMLPAVTVTPVIQKTVPLYIEGVGHIEPINSVEIKSQVTGVMTGYYFKRGQDVRKGDLLLTIDQRPYQAQLEEAQAEVARNMASLKYAEDTARRNAPLVQDDYISQNSYDDLVTNVLVSDATLKQSQAALSDAEINLGYCSIYAPLDGRTSDLLVDPGNLVFAGANETLLTLNQLSPIYATFTIPDRYLPVVQRYQKKCPLRVLAWVEDKECPPYEGVLDLIDNMVNVSTGMVTIKANMPNEDKFLWPGQFVDCHLVLEMLNDALLIPTAAIQHTTSGQYVYVVDKDNNAEKRDIEVGQYHPFSTRVVTKGLQPGEMVILEGQINVINGKPVSVKATKNAEEAIKVQEQIEQSGMPQ